MGMEKRKAASWRRAVIRLTLGLGRDAFGSLMRVKLTTVDTWTSPKEVEDQSCYVWSKFVAVCSFGSFSAFVFYSTSV